MGLREKNKQKKINMAAGGQREGESPPVGEREASERGTRSVDGERETKAVNGETETKAVTGERGWRERDPKRVNGERETVSVNRERETKAVNGERGWRERDTRSVNGERDDDDEQNGTNGSLSTGNTRTHTHRTLVLAMLLCAMLAAIVSMLRWSCGVFPAGGLMKKPPAPLRTKEKPGVSLTCYYILLQCYDIIASPG